VFVRFQKRDDIMPAERPGCDPPHQRRKPRDSLANALKTARTRNCPGREVFISRETCFQTSIVKRDVVVDKTGWRAEPGKQVERFRTGHRSG